MSSTNRGAKRIEADFYPTPQRAFEPLVPYLKKLPGPIWEPACGDRRLVNWMLADGVFAGGADLSDGRDFLKDGFPRATILTNPPFSLALEFCDHAIRHSDNVMMLLRLNFLGSKKRRGWWRAHEPSAIFVLSERPDFTGGGGDSCDYGWFYWGKIHTGIFHL